MVSLGRAKFFLGVANIGLGTRTSTRQNFQEPKCSILFLFERKKTISFLERIEHNFSEI